MTVLGSIAPMLVESGIVPSAIGSTQATEVAAWFLVVGVVLGIFAIPYTAIVKRIRNAGAFYAIITRGLGRVWGVAAGLQSAVSYTCFQVASYGILGSVASGLLQSNFHKAIPWWVCALVAWCAAFVYGLVDIKKAARVVSFLLIIEVIYIVVVDVIGLMHPTGGAYNMSALKTASPTSLSLATLGSGVVIAITGFTGFEQPPVYGEEAKNPQNTVRRAVYSCLIGMTALSVASAVALMVYYGPGRVIEASGAGPDMLFAMGGHYGLALGHVLLLTSASAAVLSFHGSVVRNLFAMGRERVLPHAFGRVNSRGVPHVASLTLSGVGLAIILLYAWRDWDPMTRLFFYSGTAGAFGILILLAATSWAILGYYVQYGGEGVMKGKILPALAGVLLTFGVWLGYDNYYRLIGVEPGSTLAWATPAFFFALAIVGVLYALFLKSRRPRIYRAIGRGADQIDEDQPHPEAPLSAYLNMFHGASQGRHR